ncbi:MAG: cytochrome P450 [Myxococcales bacterium]|nr:cytochrome P450 [Myxococcales bacterium]
MIPFARGRLPVVGHFAAYARDSFAFLEEASRVGPMARIEFPVLKAVLVNDPDLVEDIFITQHRHFSKDMFARDLKRVLGEGLLTSEGDLWRRQRRLAQPAFHRERIAGYADAMVSATEATVDAFRHGERRDLHADLMKLTLQIVGRTLFGVDTHALADEIGEALEAVLARYVDPIAMGVPHWDKLPTPLNRRFVAGVAQLDRIMRDLVRSHRAGKTGNGHDLLSMLIAARDEDGTGMSDDQLRDETLTLILAGHETTAIALTFTFLLLARHPDVRAKLEAELAEVLGGRSPTHADLPRLAYAEQVFKEAMRLYPPAWSTGREAVTDVVVGGEPIEKGTQLWVVQWNLHRDPRFHRDPLVFDPSRWAGDAHKKLHRFAYWPFGGGPRMCIGHGFAMMEGVLLLSTIAQRVRLSIDPGHQVELVPSVTLRPKGGLPVKAERR